MSWISVSELPWKHFVRFWRSQPTMNRSWDILTNWRVFFSIWFPLICFWDTLISWIYSRYILCIRMNTLRGDWTDISAETDYNHWNWPLRPYFLLEHLGPHCLAEAEQARYVHPWRSHPRRLNLGRQAPPALIGKLQNSDFVLKVELHVIGILWCCKCI